MASPLPAQYGKHPDFVVRQESPFNGGPPLDFLNQDAQTASDLFFVRNHGKVPEVDTATYRLEVDGEVAHTLVLSLDELQQNFPRASVCATLQCAGNRREELIEAKPVPGELSWGLEAISHAEWSGVRMRDVLAMAGVTQTSDHQQYVAFRGLDETARNGVTFNFGGSIPLEKALGSEALLADRMNSQPLLPVHGFPLRGVVPGYIGARSIKWLKQITVQHKPSDNYFQAHAYQLFPPYIGPENVKWEEGMALGESSITSVICSHQSGQRVKAGRVLVQGYALAGGNRQVARVDVSSDGGSTWEEAELLGEAQAWSWRLWRAEFDLQAGRHQLVVRAMDTAANTQPSEIMQVWNFKGYANNAWHRIEIEVGD
jgi:sulfite oxidase